MSTWKRPGFRRGVANAVVEPVDYHRGYRDGVARATRDAMPLMATLVRRLGGDVTISSSDALREIDTVVERCDVDLDCKVRLRVKKRANSPETPKVS